MKQLIMILVLSFLLVLAGCGAPEQEELTITELPANENVTIEAPVNETVVEEMTEEAVIEEETTETEENATEDIGETEVEELSNQEVITIFNFAPHPDELDIKVGTTVTWVNEDENFQHIIGWSKMPGRPGVIPPGASWNHTFDAPGEVIWYSTPKPTVQGTITITE